MGADLDRMYAYLVDFDDRTVEVGLTLQLEDSPVGCH
jgi:hypothetical protein